MKQAKKTNTVGDIIPNSPHGWAQIVHLYAQGLYEGIWREWLMKRLK